MPDYIVKRVYEHVKLVRVNAHNDQDALMKVKQNKGTIMKRRGEGEGILITHLEDYIITAIEAK